MKTKQEIFDYVSKQTWYVSFCTNCFRRACELDNYEFKFSQNLIYLAFIWDYTPEGFDYWNEIDEEYRDWYGTEPITELTLEQIAEKFNVPVSQLRIKENE